MAHDMTNKDTALYANKPAWHRLGNVFDGDPTIDEALEGSGLDWTVSKFPLYCEKTGETLPMSFDSHVGIRRDDTGDLLGVVGSDFGLVQNAEVFDILRALGDDVRIESAFSMKSGRRIVIMAQMKGSDEIVTGDQTERYLMIQTAHDGSSAIHVIPTHVRVVCGNTWRMAIDGRKEATSWKIRHTKNAAQRVEQAVEMIGKANKLFDGDIALARELVDVKLTAKTWETYLDAVCPLPKHDEPSPAQKAHSTRVTAVRDDITERYMNGELNNLPGMERTAWAAFNAVTEYVDHGDASFVRGEDDRAKLESDVGRRLEGSGDSIKRKAWKAARLLVPAGA